MNTNHLSLTLITSTVLYVIQGLRHSFRDRLRTVECQSEIIDQLGGWSMKSLGQFYGKSYKITVLNKSLLKLSQF